MFAGKGDPIEIYGSLKYAPEDGTFDSIATQPDLSEADSEEWSTAYSLADCTGSDLATGVPEASLSLERKSLHEDQLAEIITDVYDRMLNILDDRYWRSHGKAPRDGHGKADFNSPYSRNATHSTYAPNKSRGGHVDGFENSDAEEEDSGTDDRRCPPAVVHKKSSLSRVGYPFYKNNPVVFERCNVKGFIKISYLKDYLKKMHQEPHCERCLKISAATELRNHRCGRRKEYPAVVSRDALTRIIDQRADRKKGLKGQWMEIYQILFPDAQPPFPSPYVQNQTLEIARHFEKFLQEDRSWMWQEMNKNLPWGTHLTRDDLEAVLHEVPERWISRAVHMSLPNEQIDLDNKPGSEPRHTHIFNDLGQKHSSNDAFYLSNSHQRATAGLSCTQQPSSSDSGAYLGLEPINQYPTNTPSQSLSAKSDDFLAGLSAGDSVFMPGLSDASMYGNLQDMDMSYMPYPTNSDLSLQRLSFEPYHTQLPERFVEGIEQGVGDHAPMLSFDPEPWPSYLRLDWVNQPNYGNSDQFSPSSPSQANQKTIH
ncbi:hypothetical protein GGR54DRAFT_527873 [Hypoxylon sp. NC1633]|nr:hypothetical protein GGR54DRAFT_527873 [Hypoxylon sp. NC1633]